MNNRWDGKIHGTVQYLMMFEVLCKYDVDSSLMGCKNSSNSKTKAETIRWIYMRKGDKITFISDGSFSLLTK